MKQAREVVSFMQVGKCQGGRYVFSPSSQVQTFPQLIHPLPSPRTARCDKRKPPSKVGHPPKSTSPRQSTYSPYSTYLTTRPHSPSAFYHSRIPHNSPANLAWRNNCIDAREIIHADTTDTHGGLNKACWWHDTITQLSWRDEVTNKKLHF